MSAAPVRTEMHVCFHSRYINGFDVCSRVVALSFTIFRDVLFSSPPLCSLCSDLHASALLQLPKRTEAHRQNPLHSPHLRFWLLAQPPVLHQRGVLRVLWHSQRLLRRYWSEGTPQLKRLAFTSWTWVPREWMCCDTCVADGLSSAFIREVAIFVLVFPWPLGIAGGAQTCFLATIWKCPPETFRPMLIKTF